MIDVIRYIGKPYKDNCRDGTGYDCYTLFLDIQDYLGNKIPDLGSFDCKNSEHRIGGIDKWKKIYPFEKIDKPIEGCVAIIYYNAMPQHIGVYIGDGFIIHATENRGVVIDEMNILKIEGFYRVINDESSVL